MLLLKIPSLGFSQKVVDWYISPTCPVEHSMLMFMTNFLPSQSSIRIHYWALLFLLYINDIPQAVDCDLFLYTDDTSLLFHDKDLEWMKKELTKNFSNIRDWFVDNNLSIHFGEDKTKSILFSTKNRKKKIGTLNRWETTHHHLFLTDNIKLEGNTMQN